MMSFITANWEWVLLGLYVLEKAVKLSPSKKDDVVFDKSSNDRWKNKEKERFNHELNGNDIYLSIDIELQMTPLLL